MKYDRQKLRWGAKVAGLSVGLGGIVTFLGYFAEALVSTFGKPIGLGVFVAFCTLSLVLAASERRD